MIIKIKHSEATIIFLMQNIEAVTIHKEKICISGISGEDYRPISVQNSTKIFAEIEDAIIANKPIMLEALE